MARVSKSLLQVLQENTIMHPTTVREINVFDNKVCIKLDGYPWWLGKETSVILEGSAEIDLLGVTNARLTDSCLVDTTYNADFETFEVFDLADISWNKGLSSEVFCAQPLDDPIAVLSALETFLQQTECPLPWTGFINASTIAEFTSLAQSNIFQVAQGPRAICDFIASELSKQGIKHSITTSESPYVIGQLVKWWDGFLICADTKISWIEP